MTFNPTVNHVSDETKKGGIVESYQYVPMSVTVIDPTTNQEVVQTQMMRINFVIWPGHPVPFVHEEFSADLAFDNVYVGSIDEKDDDEANDLNAKVVELLEAHDPDLYEKILADAEADLEDEEEEEEEEEEIDADESGVEITN